MTLGTMALVLLALLIASIAIAARLLRNNATSRFRWSFLLGHFCLIVGFAFFAFPMMDEAQGSLIFLLLVAFDFPISLLFFLTREILPGLHPSQFTESLLTFVVLGGIQYFIAGWIIDKLITRKQEAPSKRAVP